MKTKAFIRKRTNYKNQIIVFLLIVFLCGYMGYMFTHTDQLKREYTTVYSSEAASTESTERITLVNNTTWRQQISISTNGYIKYIKFRLVDISPNITGSIHVTLTGVDNELLYSIDIPCTALIDGTYYMMSGFTEVELSNINLRVNKNEKLYFDCTAHNVQNSPAFSVCHRTNSDTLWIDGQQLSGEFLPLEYQIITRVQYYWIAALIILLFTVTIYRILHIQHTYIWYMNLCCLMAPGIILLCGTWLTGNTFYLKTSYGFINLILIYAFYFIFLSLAGRKPGMFLFLLCSTGIILGNYYLYQFRGQPLMVTDIFSIGTALTVTQNYKLTINFSILTVLAIAVLMVISVSYSSFKHIAEKLKLAKGKLYRLRIIALCIGALVLFGSYHIAAMDLSGWNINDSFSKYGWIYTNIKLIKSFQNITPKGYDKADAEEFVETEAIKEDTFSGIRPLNLIVIMNESFSDLSILGEFKTNKEVMPYFNSLTNNPYTEKGWLNVHVIGGGTTTTEWEVLTGGNSTFLNIGSLSPYNLLVSGSSDYNYMNLCTAAKASDYKAIAMHPFYGANYSRDKLYPMFGFDEFKNLDNYYQEADWIRWCVSDEADIDTIIEQYENKDSEKLFIFNVTMQNHGAYSYPMENYTIQSTDQNSDELNSYLSLIHYSDLALEKLLTYFSAVEEPTMIVFFGDHQPALTDKFYETVLQTTSPSELQNEMKYITPYLIWSNYPRKVYNMPFINAGYLGAIIKSEAGLELTIWDRYLLSVMQKYPVIGNYGFFNSSYEFNIYADINNIDREYLSQMKYAQYYWWTY